MSDVEGFAARAAKLGYRLDDEQAAAVHAAVVADQDAALRLQKRSPAAASRLDPAHGDRWVRAWEGRR
jgi:hypothetical protein